MKTKKVKVGDDLYKMMCRFTELTNSDIGRRAARKAKRCNILPDVRKVPMIKPCHVINVELPDSLYDVPVSSIRKVMRDQLGQVRKVTPLKIDQADLKYKNQIDSSGL